MLNMKKDACAWRLFAVLAVLAFGVVGQVYAQSGTPVLYFDVPNTTFYEGDGFAKLTVRASQDHPNTAITCFYQTEDGTAKAPLDFAPQAGKIVLPPGVNSADIYIPLVNDGASEGNETFTVRISDPDGATITPLIDSITITIVDGDRPASPTTPTVSFEFTSWTVNQLDGTAVVTVSMSGTPSGPVYVTASTTTGGTASPGVDYVPASQLLVFRQSETGSANAKSFTIPITDRCAMNVKLFQL